MVGTTSRTLRHYDELGLLNPTRMGTNGYRYYDQGSLVRLQRILLLRELGLGLQVIGTVLDQEADPGTALETHLEWVRQEQQRLARQAASIERTLKAVKDGEEIMAEHMFDGFDSTQYRDEVEERWGKAAYAAGDAWWRGKSGEQKRAFQKHARDLSEAWTTAAEQGIAPGSEHAQALAQRHVEWLAVVPGTPIGKGKGDSYLLGLGDLYVADPRFGANYGGRSGAILVRDALRIYVGNNPSAGR